MLLRLYNVRQHNLDHIHLAACWISLSRLSKRHSAERRWLRTNAKALGPLVQHTLQAAKGREIGAKQVVTIAYGAACSGMRQLLGVLFAALARGAERRLGEFNAQNLANTTWSFATVG